jgi:hypothetical protein
MYSPALLRQHTPVVGISADVKGHRAEVVGSDGYDKESTFVLSVARFVLGQRDAAIRAISRSTKALQRNQAEKRGVELTSGGAETERTIHVVGPEDESQKLTACTCDQWLTRRY